MRRHRSSQRRNILRPLHHRRHSGVRALDSPNADERLGDVRIALDVYLNDGSRIDFTAVSFVRPSDGKCHAYREQRKSARS